MKIKEVIAKTGLTDRAIRLYIENGLIVPNNQKSYAGRNNFHFSPEDVQKLEQIALLRKAGFSLEQIKTLECGGELAQKVLSEYLKDKQEAAILEQKIVEALQDFPANTPVTTETVCERIQEKLKNIPLPKTDEKPSKGEQKETWFMRIGALGLLLFFGFLALVFSFGYAKEFPFHRYYISPLHHIGTAYIAIPIMAAVIILILYRKPEFTAKKQKRRRLIANIALAIAMLVGIQPMGFVSLGFVPPVYSETDNPRNYLVLGTYPKMYGNDIYQLFPANIPRCAVTEGSAWYPPDKFKDTTKYYYYFQHYIDPSFQIYAEWVLPKEEYEAELLRIQNMHPNGPVQQVTWGAWTCLSFTNDTLVHEEAKQLISYYYLLFAYNEQTGGVRYIASYSMDTGQEDDPYFLQIPWE